MTEGIARRILPRAFPRGTKARLSESQGVFRTAKADFGVSEQILGCGGLPSLFGVRRLASACNATVSYRTPNGPSRRRKLVMAVPQSS